MVQGKSKTPEVNEGNSDPKGSLENRIDCEEPGVFPFTRGIHRDMYQKRHWTMRQYAGFGTAEETNAHYHYLLDKGSSGLSVACLLYTSDAADE